MHWATLAAFAFLELTLCLIPGPAVLLTVSSALRRGVRTGLAAACGILAGNTLYFVLSGLGVVALLLASARVFVFLKWGGALYLAYLGLRALFARKGIVPDPAALESGERRRAFAAGFLTQVSNPKAIVFFVAILPQFIDTRAPLAAQLVALTLISTTIEAIVLTGYSLGAGALRRSAAVERASLWIERIGGAVLIAIAARIAREPLVSP
ncbi:MAG: LysE family translocator [Candidatus Eremiobacteraeota bacterium]|nr:LysE family translocator [Candidatus Eremiobacteraeota bacterium]